LEKIIQEAEQSALDTIEKNQKLQDEIDKRKEVEEARKQKEQETQQNIYDLVDKIKSYFVEGEFTKTLVKTATLIGEGIAKIVGVISDVVKNISNNSAGIFGNFAQVAGGFLKGMVGESSATKVIDSAIAYANARGYTGVVSMLGSARKSVTEKMADSADTQTKAATAQDIAARGQAAAAIEQAKAAEEQKIAAEQQRINLEKLAEQQRKDIERRAEQHTKFLEDLQKAFVDPYKEPLDPNQVMAGPGDLADARTLLYGRNSSSWGNWGPGQFYKKMPGEPTPRYDRTGSYWGVGPYGVPGLASNMMSKDPVLASSLNIRNAIMGHTAQQYGQGSFYNDPYINYAPRTSAEKNAMLSFFGLPEGSTISSKYGSRSSGNHYGIDFATGGQRKPVYAPFAGTVVASKRDTGSGYGNTMAIFYPEISTVFKYAHLHKAPLAAHTSVKAGDEIGIIGNTGTSRGATGIHLHLETIPITDKSQLTEGFLYNRNIYHKITTNPIGIFKQYEGKQSARAAFGSPTNTPVAPEPKPTQVEARVTGAGASGDLRNASAQGGAGNVAFTQYNFNNNTTSTTASNNVPDDFNLLQLMMIGLGGY
ncbi:MAG: peptidoglycan DD-metalloendopeptidase family protein, partial [Candidatus Methanomethylophilaceae archaeon]|nr:peptidoglycan DD-metalloendopeptidase family protein [Candidatus Methanomethylophilaceae archaeon]